MATTQAAPTDAEQEGNDQASHPTTADDSQLEAQEVSDTDIIGKITYFTTILYFFWTLFNKHQIILVLQHTQS